MATAKKKSKDTKIALPVLPIAGSAAAIFLLAGLVWFVFLRERQPPPAEENVGRHVADQFLAEVRANRTDAAWQLTSAEFKSDEGRESFAGWVTARPHLAQELEFKEYRVREFNGLKQAECIYQASSNPTAPPVRILIGQELGEWKVDGVRETGDEIDSAAAVNQ